MSSLIGRPPSGNSLQQALQFAQVVHAQTVEVAPARDAEQVVDHHGGIAFAG